MFYFDIAYFVVFVCSALMCALIISTKDFYLRSRKNDTKAVQSTHVRPTPRVGGLAIGGSLIVSIFLVPQSVQTVYTLCVLSLIPVFVAGLSEDLGRRVKPVWRLFAAALSSLLAIMMLQIWVGRIDIPGMDWLLGFTVIAIAFTMFATAGVCHSFNLIDGLNGLSSGAGIMTCLGLAVISHATGHSDLASVCFLVIAALMGFLVFNYPWGKLFLGDAGAYSLGHVLAWLSVILMVRVPDLTPWAVVLVFFWPVADTILAIFRRRAGRNADQADKMHYHHLVMRFIEIRFLGRGRRGTANPLATLVMLPFVALPVVVGVWLWDQPMWASLAVLIFGASFVGSYWYFFKVAGATHRPQSQRRLASAK